MNRSFLINAAFASTLAAVSLALVPQQASAFILRSTLTGDARSAKNLTMSTHLTISQGADAGLAENQAEWLVELLDTGDVATETGPDANGDGISDRVGFDDFGFNLSDTIVKLVSFSSPTPSNWIFSGTGDSDKKLTGAGNMPFDYLFSAPTGNDRSALLRFIMTSSGGALVKSDFKDAPFSSGAGGELVGQAGAHVIGFENPNLDKDSRSGVVTGKVPTPAMLPGLIGMGVAALRKRKQGEQGELLEQEA